MADFFDGLYSIFFTHSDPQFYDIYNTAGLTFVLTSLLFIILYYYVFNYFWARYYKLGHWFFFLIIDSIIILVVVLLICSSYELVISNYFSDIFLFALLTSLFGAVLFFLWSLALKWWSKNAKYTPF